ncbi:Nicotinamide mononucleotide transporter [Candidatus Hepatincola sp. Pdp]
MFLASRKFTFWYVIIFFISSLIISCMGSYLDYQNLPTINLISITGLILTFISGMAGVICVILVVKETIWNFLFGLISGVAWFLYVIFYSPLIWDALINVIYIILDCYGVYYWLYPTNKLQQTSNQNVALTRRLTFQEYVVYIFSMFLAIGVMGAIGVKFGRYINNIQAFADATTTIFAIIAKFLMARKVLESWILWILVNIISIPLYISIGSYTLVGAWVLYLINSIYGFYMWHAKMQQDKQHLIIYSHSTP